MDGGDMCGFLFFGGLGLLFVASGIQMRLGTDKTWFYPSDSPRVVPVLAFGSIPIGLGLLILIFSLLGREFDWLGERNGAFVLFGAGLPLIFLGIVFAAWRPRWLKPRWFRWLEDNYGDIMGELRQDAQRLDRLWLDRVRTQEGLEKWAEEVRQRHQAET